MIIPDFFPRFHCKAGACRVTCCQKWEIDIDDETAWYYDQVEGPLGERIRDAILYGEDGDRFRLNEKGFCPLLREDGLCEIVCQLGEEALCDICALHPRFYADVGERELGGLGLCCEAVCELILETEAPLTFCCEETGEAFRIEELLAFLHLPVLPVQFEAAAPSPAFLRGMERTEAIDDAWPQELDRLEKDLAAHPVTLPQGGRYDRILAYILYRVLDRCPEYPMPVLIRYAKENAAFIAAQDALYGTCPEHLRRWSEQIEYSTENVDLLLQALTVPTS